MSGGKIDSFTCLGVTRSLSNDTKLDGLTVPTNCLLRTHYINVGVLGSFTCFGVARECVASKSANFRSSIFFPRHCA